VTTHQLFFAVHATLLCAAGYAWLVQRFSRRATLAWLPLTLCLLAGVATVLSPAGQFPVWLWAYSAHANLSLSLVAVSVVMLIQASTGYRWFRRTDWWALWAVGALAGVVLYLPSLGLPFYDPYRLHWDGRWVWVGWIAVTVALLAFGNRAGVLLLAGLLGHLLDALESDNLWDYMIDPPFWLLSVAGLAVMAMRKSPGRRAGVPPVGHRERANEAYKPNVLS
jgi:hypothetical protein